MQVFRLTHHKAGTAFSVAQWPAFACAALRVHGGGSARESHPVVYYPAKAMGPMRALGSFLYASILFFAPRFVNSGGRYKKDRRIFGFASAVKAALEFNH